MDLNYSNIALTFFAIYTCIALTFSAVTVSGFEVGLVPVHRQLLAQRLSPASQLALARQRRRPGLRRAALLTEHLHTSRTGTYAHTARAPRAFRRIADLLFMGVVDSKSHMT